MRSFWCEIDLDRLDENIAKVRENTDKFLMAVVKAGAYGVGIEDFTKYLDDKVDCFGVSTVEEAMKVSSDKDILVLYPVLSDEDIENVKDNFILTIDNREILDRLKATGRNFRVHIYVDTGMNRFGIKPGELGSFIETIENEHPEISLEGIYTHLHNTHNRDYTIKQIVTFKNAIENYKDRVKYIHLLNSGGFLKFNSDCSFDNLVRLGNLLYGYDASEYGYKRIFSYKAVPIRVYTVDKGEYIGYGCYYKARKPVRIGILDLGYIDDFYCSRRVKNNIFKDMLKAAYYHFKYYSGIFYSGRAVRIIGKPNLNFTLISMEGIEDDAVLSIDMTTITADSSIPKKWRKGDTYVQL